MDGFYSAYFTGVHGSGYALFVMREGVIVGADPAGGSFDGQYGFNEDAQSYDGTIVMSAPAGTVLVTGAQVGSEPVQFPIPVRLPANFDNGQVIGVETPTGPINVTFRKIRGMA